MQLREIKCSCPECVRPEVEVKVAKFNVGDTVNVLSHAISHKGKKGTIESAHLGGYIKSSPFGLSIERDHIYRVKIGKGTAVFKEDELEKLRIENIPFHSMAGITFETVKVIIYGSTTILFYKNPVTNQLDRAVAQCHPKDTFDKDVGIKVAMFKAAKQVAQDYILALTA